MRDYTFHIISFLLKQSSLSLTIGLFCIYAINRCKYEGIIFILENSELALNVGE